MVVTELRRNEQGQFEEAEKRSPAEVEKSARAIVDKVNVQKLEIMVKVVSWPSGKAANTARGTICQQLTLRKPKATSTCSSLRLADGTFLMI